MFPKEGRPFLNNWIQSVGSWEKVRPGLLSTVEYLRANGVTTIGAYGFCFGAKKLMQASRENLFKCVALVHPSFFQPEERDNANVPGALLPSGVEDKYVMEAYWKKIEHKPIAAKST